MKIVIMTLIAHSTNFSYPIIIGDILMSSTEKGTKIELPTFLSNVDNKLPGDQKFFPYKLRQKIYVIKDNLVLALAGLEFEMKLFLEDIINYFKFFRSTKEEIEKFYNEYDFSNFTNSSLLIVYSEKKEEGQLIHQITRGNWKHKESPTLEHLYTCGSGSNFFIEMSGYYDNFHGSGDTNLSNRAISLNYTNLSNLLSIERLSLNTIKEYWGAGFEMIYFNGNKFKKINDITYVIWKGKVNLDDETYEMSPFLALNFRYFEDILIVTSTDFNKVEGYAVLPIHINKNDVDVGKIPNKINFNSKKICCTFVLEFSNGEIHSPSFFSQKNLDHPGVKIDFKEDGHTEIWINSELQEKLVKDTITTVKSRKRQKEKTI
jgi:hypothetical protein